MNQGQNKSNIDSVLKKLTEDIMNDTEGFFDTERCLACIDAGKVCERMSCEQLNSQKKVFAFSDMAHRF